MKDDSRDSNWVPFPFLNFKASFLKQPNHMFSWPSSFPTRSFLEASNPCIFIRLRALSSSLVGTRIKHDQCTFPVGESSQSGVSWNSRSGTEEFLGGRGGQAFPRWETFQPVHIRILETERRCEPYPKKGKSLRNIMVQPTTTATLYWAAIITTLSRWWVTVSFRAPLQRSKNCKKGRFVSIKSTQDPKQPGRSWRRGPRPLIPLQRGFWEGKSSLKIGASSGPRTRFHNAKSPPFSSITFVLKWKETLEQDEWAIFIHILPKTWFKMQSIVPFLHALQSGENETEMSVKERG